jgi:hypothetical protein
MSFASHRSVASALALILLAAGCAKEPAPATPPAASAEPAADASWSAFAAGFIEARFKADPYFAVGNGRHEFDGQMPDWSRAAIEADIAALRESLARVNQFDSAALTAPERFERDYMKWVIETQLFWQVNAELPFRNPAWYIERLDPSMYLTREYAPLPKRLEGYLGYARAIPGLTANIRANLRTPLPKAFIERGAAGFGGYASFFKDEMPAILAGIADEKLKKDLTDATAAAASSMAELTAWLESQRATGTSDYALGAPKFQEMLRVTELVDTPLEELEAIGRKDLERARSKARAPSSPICGNS